MKNFLIALLLIWECLCLSGAIKGFKNWSAGDFIFMILVMAIPIAIIVMVIRRIDSVKLAKENEIAKAKMLAAKEIESLKKGLPVIEKPSFLLVDEKLHFYKPATYITVENKLAGYAGSTSSQKGSDMFNVDRRVGNFSSKAVYKDVSKTHRGFVAVTEKQIIFVHEAKGFVINLPDIISLMEYDDGVIIQSNNVSYPIMLDNPKYFLELVKIAEKTK